LISCFVTNKLSAKDLGGWGLSDEELYWIDHEEREIHLENPNRDFLEVRGIDTCWSGQTIMENFAMLKEADYQIRLRGDAPMLQIHFSFAEEIPETGYEAYLINGFCVDEDYEMTVKNMETNELYQQQKVSLSIELPDMISFLDLNADGYLDMQIDRPVHSSGRRAVIEEYKSPYYMLWNPQEEIFEIKNDNEIAESRRQNQRQEVHMTEYVVQPGDTLWGIAKKFYGTGSWYERIEKENADVLSGNKYLLPGISIRIPIQPSASQ
ncbi:MAG: LysM peptidoglycan-binding domain-containing protein, partial [Lachnospiraceae bacterium]|nr:LysM peptidoglycan-binding domain-containing protein [Lachnospiraceae bacterium]